MVNHVSQPTNWVVITGAPSSGKTSLINEFKARGFETQPESSRAVIEEKLRNGITLEDLLKDPEALEKAIVEREIALQKIRQTDKFIFLDRGMGDRVAYDRFIGLDEKLSFAAASQYRNRAVFILDRLPLEKDGVRLENEQEARQLDVLLEKAYGDLGYKPTRIRVMPIAHRANLILQNLGVCKSAGPSIGT